MWESGARKMPSGLWRLFQLMTGADGVTYEKDGRRAVLRLVIEAPDRTATA